LPSHADQIDNRLAERKSPGNQGSSGGEEDAYLGNLRENGCKKRLHQQPPEHQQTADNPLPVSTALLTRPNSPWASTRCVYRRAPRRRF